jgi:MFS family permease
MAIKNNTRREVIAGSIRIASLLVGLFIFPHLKFALQFYVGLDFWEPLISAIILVALFLFAKKIAKFLIWEDVEVNTKSMFKRFLISCFAGIVWFGLQYYLTYPQREGFSERTKYPASMLTLHAIFMGIVAALVVFVIWYFILYLIALVRHLKSPKLSDS